MTIEAAPMNRQEAQRLTERIRVALDRVSTAWADLGERITEAYQRRADLALGYGSWQEYAEAELKPTEGLAAEVRRQLVGMLSQAGMSTRAIAPTVGVTQQQVSRDQQVTRDVSPEPSDRIDYETGEVLDEESASGTWEDYWPGAPQPEAPKPEPAPRVDRLTGLDGKTYPRPAKPAKDEGGERRQDKPARPTKYGPRAKHAQIIAKAIVSGNGICIALDEITELDNTLTQEEAARYADDLSSIIRSLKRIQSLIKKEV